ncbi:MAG: flagellar biosynthetic protein FliO [Casimicrobiaceae bacterium]
MVLAINPDFEEVVLDIGAEARANARLLRAPHLLVMSQLAQIRIQFWTGRAGATMFEDQPALRVRLPTELLRVQRRQYYRVRVPARVNLSCLLPPMHAADPPVRARVVNLSCGGAAITDLPVAMRVEPGTQLQPCRLTSAQGVGQRERVIEIAEQWLVVGVASGSVNALATLPKGMLPPASVNASFAGLLARGGVTGEPKS